MTAKEAREMLAGIAGTDRIAGTSATDPKQTKVQVWSGIDKDLSALKDHERVPAELRARLLNEFGDGDTATAQPEKEDARPSA